MTNIIPLNDIARQHDGLFLCSAGFVSSKSNMYVLSARGCIKEVKQADVLKVADKTRVMIAPSGLVRDVVKTNINRTDNAAYAVFDLVPPADMIQVINRKRFLLACAVVFLTAASVYLIDMMNIVDDNKTLEVTPQAVEGHEESFIGDESFNNIMDILKSDSVIAQVAKTRDTVHTAEFIERIRVFHSDEQRASNSARDL